MHGCKDLREGELDCAKGEKTVEDFLDFHISWICHFVGNGSVALAQYQGQVEVLCFHDA